jgi:hypothetical protein
MVTSILDEPRVVSPAFFRGYIVCARLQEHIQ